MILSNMIFTNFKSYWVSMKKVGSSIGGLKSSSLQFKVGNVWIGPGTDKAIALGAVEFSSWSAIMDNGDLKKQRKYFVREKAKEVSTNSFKEYILYRQSSAYTVL